MSTREQFPLRSASLAQIATMPDPAKLYDYITVSRWNGMPNYECPVCMYADLDRARTEEHIRQRHVIPAIALAQDAAKDMEELYYELAEVSDAYDEQQKINPEPPAAPEAAAAVDSNNNNNTGEE